MRFGENMNYERWQELKTKIDKKKSIFFRYSEYGIIVFVDLRPGGDDYLKRFYKIFFPYCWRFHKFHKVFAWNNLQFSNIALLFPMTYKENSSAAHSIQKPP
jgi:hypothetical protein